MNTYFDCMPCFIRQTLDAARFATSDKNIHESVLREVFAALSTMDLEKSPPQMGQIIHRIIRKSTGNIDPYKAVKKQSNDHVLALIPKLKGTIRSSPNAFETAVRFAMAGNIIDFGLNTKIDQHMINKSVEQALSNRLFGDIAPLRKAVFKAREILYLADNAGEIVFDRLFIELLPLDKITLAVRGNPVLNDATIDDAKDTGVTDIVRVIDNGSDAPGTILEGCSITFRQAFQNADLIISKGQGNYETLSNSSKAIFFLLKAKCPVIAEHIGCEVGDVVIKSINEVV